MFKKGFWLSCSSITELLWSILDSWESELVEARPVFVLSWILETRGTEISGSWGISKKNQNLLNKY